MARGGEDEWGERREGEARGVSNATYLFVAHEPRLLHCRLVQVEAGEG